MLPLRFSFLWFLLFPAALVCSLIAEETISIDEIEPGDRGEWKTVISGTEIETFPLTVVGIVDSFVGPGMPIILCRANDPENTGTGPVSGMSGSPVYIDGRLAGAYAYGFPWSKEKTLIGVTPIEWMEPLYDYTDTPYRETQDAALPPKSAVEASIGVQGDFASLRADSGSAASPISLPLPLIASGISPKTLEAIHPWLAERGLFLTAGAGGGGNGGGSGNGADPKFEAGSPLSVILASGDLTIGGVGTITQRKGDRLIAFGHPMLGSGSVELPVGSAEIVDVVSNYRISFKLSNIGEVAGTLWQDSTPGIQAELGRIPYMVPIRVTSDEAIKSPVEGKIAEHRQFLPFMGLIYAAQTVLTSQEGPAESTIRGKLSLAIEGEEEPLEMSRVGIGTGGAMDILFSFAQIMDMVINGSQEFPRLGSIDVDFQTENEERRQILHSLRLDSGRIRADEPVRLTIITRKRNGEAEHHTVEIPLPQAAPGSQFSVFVADADALRRYDQIGFRDPSRSLDELLTELRQIRDNGSIYVQLLRPEPGLRLDGQNLEQLPPSVLRLFQTSLDNPGETFLRESVVWETAIPVPGVFTGSSRVEFTTEP